MSLEKRPGRTPAELSRKRGRGSADVEAKANAETEAEAEDRDGDGDGDDGDKRARLRTHAESHSESHSESESKSSAHVYVGAGADPHHEYNFNVHDLELLETAFAPEDARNGLLSPDLGPDFSPDVDFDPHDLDVSQNVFAKEEEEDEYQLRLEAIVGRRDIDIQKQDEIDAQEDAQGQVDLVVRDVKDRATPDRLRDIRASVRAFLEDSANICRECRTVAWVRRLNLRAYYVESEEAFEENVFGPCTSGVFVVDTITNEYKIGAAVIYGVFGSKYIVVLDCTTSLELIFAVVLGAMNACGLGCTAFIALDACDGRTQANVARVFPISQFCTYEYVYPAVLRRLRIDMKPGFHETRMTDCELRHCLKARRTPPVTTIDLHAARWFESELGTLAIAMQQRPDVAVDVVVLLFSCWCEEAYYMVHQFLQSQVRENLLLYLQRDGDTGPDVVSRTEMLERMRRVKPYRPVCKSGLTMADIHEVRHQFPVMAFEGAEVFVHYIDGPAARRLFARIYKRSDIISMHNDVLFIALSKTYSHIVSYAVCASDAAAMTVVAARRLIDELWHAMFQFSYAPLQVARGTRLTVPNNYAVARSVLCMTPKGTSFMIAFMRDQQRPSMQKIHTKITSGRMPGTSTGPLARPHVLEQDQGVLRDRNCWKRLCGYVGMTPAFNNGVCLSETHPNTKYVVFSDELRDGDRDVIVSVLGDVFLATANHLHTIDDPNYLYVQPPFDYAANDAWYAHLTSYFADDVALVTRIRNKRAQLQAESSSALPAEYQWLALRPAQNPRPAALAPTLEDDIIDPFAP